MVIGLASDKSGANCILPPVIFWNPIQELPSVFSNEVSCNRENYKASLKFHLWRYGQSDRTKSRLIHGLTCDIVLVSCTYRCSYGHEVFSTDPIILDAIREKDVIPFILFHKSGFTRELVRLIISMFGQGMNLKSMKRVIQTSRRASLSGIHHILALKNIDITEVSVSTVISKLYSTAPTDDALRRIVIADFLGKRPSYQHELSQLHSDGIITLDHTFKIASNIGYFQTDSTWVPLYDSALFVLNENGKVLDWQMTTTTSVSEIIKLLSNLKARMEIHKRSLHTVVVDNCCNVRYKLQCILGSNLSVKLDLFHATSRITRYMSKKHPLFHQCLRNVKLLWRDPKDLGSTRKMSTPKPEVLMNNIDQFLRKWEHSEMNGAVLVGDAALKQIHAIMVHVRNGCLSDIPPGVGTNKNEALHQKLKSQLSYISRMGILFALAVFSLIISEYNSPTNSIVHGEAGHYRQELVEDNSSTIPVMGIFRKASYASIISEVTVDSAEILPESLQQTNVYIQNVVLYICQRVKTWIKLAACLNGDTEGSPLFNHYVLPFMAAVPCMLHSSDSETPSDAVVSGEHKEHTKRLRDRLSSFNFQLVPMEEMEIVSFMLCLIIYHQWLWKIKNWCTSTHCLKL